MPAVPSATVAVTVVRLHIDGEPWKEYPSDPPASAATLTHEFEHKGHTIHAELAIDIDSTLPEPDP